MFRIRLTFLSILALLAFQANAQLGLRDGSPLAPRERVSGQSRSAASPGYTPLDRQPVGIERQQRKSATEDRRLEYGTNLPRYSRERQQARDRAYSDFRDVDFISATLNREKPAVEATESTD